MQIPPRVSQFMIRSTNADGSSLAERQLPRRSSLQSSHLKEKPALILLETFTRALQTLTTSPLEAMVRVGHLSAPLVRAGMVRPDWGRRRASAHSSVVT